MKRPSESMCVIIFSLFMLSAFSYSVYITRQGPSRTAPSEKVIQQVSGVIEEYNTALKECRKDKNQETAEILNRKSMSANFMYFVIKPDLAMKQRFELGVPLAELNGYAIDTLREIKPQTRYTQHYLRSIIRRDVVWQLDAIVGRQAVMEVLLAELASADDFRKQFDGMTAKEKHEFLSQPLVEIKTKPNMQ